jgi:acyl-CoA reductase-like NAD-dependent aldehyde dehydrogenase
VRGAFEVTVGSSRERQQEILHQRRPDRSDLAQEEEVAGTISMASPADVDLAVKAARAAFPSYSQTAKAERIDMLRRIVSVYEKRYDDISMAITLSPQRWDRRCGSPSRCRPIRRLLTSTS